MEVPKTRVNRRCHRRGRHSGSVGSQFASHRDAWRFDAQKARATTVELKLAGATKRWGRGRTCRTRPAPLSWQLAASLRFAPDRSFLTETNSSCTIEEPASLRSEDVSPLARNAVRVRFGISVRLRRNPHLTPQCGLWHGRHLRRGCVFYDIPFPRPLLVKSLAGPRRGVSIMMCGLNGVV